MTEQEIEAFEKQLKAAPLPPLSDAFFARVAKQLAENSEDATPTLETAYEDLADVEAALRRLRPRAPSEAFFQKVEAELNESSRNEIAFPQKKSRAWMIRFPRRLSAAATVACAACTLAVGLHFVHNGLGEPAPHYELVSTEKQLCSVEELPIETREDGTLVRPVRYIYADTKRWRDPRTENSFIEYQPFEETVPTVVAVY